MMASDTKCCRIDGPILHPVLEFKTFKYPLTGTIMENLWASLGAVQRDRSGRAVLMHFAVGRFLAPSPTSDVVAMLTALQSAGVGALVDVRGKWRAFVLTGPAAERLLSSTVNLTLVLGNRGCAALHLFDCPSVLALRADVFEVWVEASYAAGFRLCLDDVLQSLVS